MSNTINKPTFYLPIHWGRKLLFVLLLSLFAINTAVAVSASDDASTKGVTFDAINNLVRNDSLLVSFNVHLQGKFLATGDALHIVPVYRSAEQDEVRLPRILVNGKKRARYYRREQSLLSNVERLANEPFAVIVRNDKETQSLSYSYAISLPRERSSEGTLHIEQLLEDCCDLLLVDAQQVPIQQVLKASNAPLFANTVSLITPEADKPKELKKDVSVRITYPLGASRVLPHFNDNKAELERIDNELRPLFSNSDTHEISSICIKGYTSPEDTYVYNMRLSQRRAERFKEYLIEKYGLADLTNFTCEGMSEDWEGLAKAVEASDMEEKQEVLTIINTVDIYDGREKQLMDMKWGDPYRYMAKEFFPALRRMEMEIKYTVNELNADEVASSDKQDPNEMSHRALFDMAEGKMDRDLLIVIAKYFPRDATAIINAASAVLLNDDMEEAWGYLQKVKDNPMAYNNLGVYYWLKEDTDMAASYFEKAIEHNAEAVKAEANRKMLKGYLMR